MKIWYFPIALLLVGLTCSYWFGYTPALIGLIYLLASVISYYLYAKDKRAAKNGMWRVSENTLHFSALLGGWPGSIVGQQKLRHKTKKVSFRIVFFITLLVNVSLLCWLHTPYGAEKLHTYIYKMEYWVANQFGSNMAVTALLKSTKFHHVL
jgi:uncharacterized membrane protein YsdA (DUF1294 family)